MSRPFQFSLQKVLDVRAQQEEQARLEMARAQQAYQRQVEVVEQTRADLAAHKERFRQRAEKGCNADEFWLHQRYAVRLEQLVQEAESTMLQLAKELNARRRALVEKAKERKLLEKLKQRQGVRHAQEAQLEEQKRFDEMATIRFQPPDF